jgi:redox-sensitive bicupin YhaK (pirin superfamily)
MFWDQDIPRRRFADANGRTTTVTVIAGALEGASPLPPPPHSWAADSNADLAIWSIAMEEGATWTVPSARNAETARALHLFSGAGAKVGVRVVTGPAAIRVDADQSVPIDAIEGPVEILLLQGRPIGEPVAQYGPFVMNTQAELEQAFADYRRTQFGGWPWPENAPVHPRDAGRFAKHADGRVERAS